MTTLKIRALTTIALFSLTAVVASPPTGATEPAEVNSSSIGVDQEYEAVMEDGAYIATPDELRSANLPEQDIKDLEEALKSVPVAVLTKSDANRKTDQNSFENQATGSLAIGRITEPALNEVQINRVTKDCTKRSDFYRVYSTNGNGEMYCYANSGTRNVYIDSVSRISPGNNSGRVLWAPHFYDRAPDQSPIKYYSTVRSHTTKWFNMPYQSYYGIPLYPVVYQVQTNIKF